MIKNKSAEYYKSIVKECKSKVEFAKKLGYSEASGAAYSRVNNLVNKYNLDTTHFTGQLWSKGQNIFNNEKIISTFKQDEIFCEKSCVKNTYIKKYLMQLDQRGDTCEICGIKEWMNKKIVMELDHINGIRTDNRKENLRFICPNCHSQTDTFRNKGGKSKYIVLDDVHEETVVENVKNYTSLYKLVSSLGYSRTSKNYAKIYEIMAKHNLKFKENKLKTKNKKEIKIKIEKTKKENKCKFCDIKISSGAKMCRPCAFKNSKNTKTEWPDLNILKENIYNHGFANVAKDIGVANITLRKYIKKNS